MNTSRTSLRESLLEKQSCLPKVLLLKSELNLNLIHECLIEADSSLDEEQILNKVFDILRHQKDYISIFKELRLFLAESAGQEFDCYIDYYVVIYKQFCHFIDNLLIAFDNKKAYVDSKLIFKHMLVLPSSDIVFSTNELRSHSICCS